MKMMCILNVHTPQVNVSAPQIFSSNPQVNHTKPQVRDKSTHLARDGTPTDSK